MRVRISIVTLSVVFSLSLRVLAQAPQTNAPRQLPPAMPGQPIAGIPYDEALKIVDRHHQELYSLPGVEGIGIFANGLVVTTTNPSVLPSTIEGLPIFSVLPSRQHQPPPKLSLPQPPIPPQHVEPSKEEQVSPRTDCPKGMHGVSGSVRCAFDSLPADNGPKIKFNTPPPGVIVMKPGGGKEQADSCPQGFEEVEGYNKWRFCVDPQKPERIPNLWSPPIAGVPYEKALEIHYRNVEKLSDLPGVEGVGLGAEGINVYTTNPAVLPQQIEGLRVIPRPVPVGERGTNGHTFNTQIRPLHGAVAAVDNSGGTVATLTGIVLADGKPWLVFPAHILGRCTETPPCSGGIPLNQCPHDNSQGQASMFQSPSGGINANVGFIQRWTPLGTNFYAADVAAAFMDSDFTEYNGSLSADQRVNSGPSGSIPFSGITIPVAIGVEVDMRTILGPPHDFRLRVEEVGTTFDYVKVCNNNRANLNNQIRYRILNSDFTVQSGDSGSPVFDLSPNQRLVGMENACRGIPQTDGSLLCFQDQIYGTDVTAIRTFLRFDDWYGTQTVKDNTIGVFKPNSAGWIMDNGNGKYDGPVPCVSGDPSPIFDPCFAYGLGNSDLPITGDWDNATANNKPSNEFTVGVYRPTTNPNFFLLSNTNNPPSSLPPIVTAPPSFGYQPVAGKWQGNGTSNATS